MSRSLAKARSIHRRMRIGIPMRVRDLRPVRYRGGRRMMQSSAIRAEKKVGITRRCRRRAQRIVHELLRRVGPSQTGRFGCRFGGAGDAIVAK